MADRAWLSATPGRGRLLAGYGLELGEQLRASLGIGRVVVVGQAPSERGDPRRPITGAIGRRLASLAGWRLGLPFLQVVDRANLLPEFPGRARGGDAFPLARARSAAFALAPELDGRVVLGLGRGVVSALGAEDLAPLELRWTNLGGSSFLLAHLPHPSGRNRWWNADENRRSAAAFVRRVLWEGPALAASGPGYALI